MTKTQVALKKWLDAGMPDVKIDGYKFRKGPNGFEVFWRGSLRWRAVALPE